MINTKRPSTDDYTQVGFVEAKDAQGNYRNIDHIYDNQGNIVFQQGYLDEYQGADNFSIPAIGKPLLDYTIYGNTYQASGVSPDNPIMPQGTGERTGNLAQWEKGGINTSTGANEAYRTKEQGGTCEQMRTLYIPCSENTTYILHTNLYPVQTFVSYYDVNKIYISRSSGTPQGENRVFTTPETARYMRAQLAHVTADQVYPAIEENQQYAIMLGSIALPYEPYGYKIPISSASTTTPVYLGEMETTRKIKKLVLTGEETITKAASNPVFTMQLSGSNAPLSGNAVTTLSTHYQAQNNATGTGNVGDMKVCIRRGYGTMYIGDTRYDNATDFKSYLVQQYANGTPVTIWYVLTTEQTAVVNEPLMKIGNYADTLSMEQAGVSIPTLNKPNNTVIDVETEVEPSEVDVTYRGSTKPKYDLFLAQNGDSFEAKNGQSLYIGGDL